jgi:hypothetical protein
MEICLEGGSMFFKDCSAIGYGYRYRSKVIGPGTRPLVLCPYDWNG